MQFSLKDWTFTLNGWTYYSTSTKYFKNKYVGDGKWTRKKLTIQEFAAADSEFNRKAE